MYLLDHPQFIITIVAFPLTIIALILAIVAVRRENKSLSYVIFIAELCALAYFVFKFFRLFQTSQAFRYQNSRKTLAVFSALAMIMLLCTFVCSVFCFLNFGKGLKEAIPGYFGEHRASRRQKISRKNSNAAGTMLAPPPSRMEID
jgi:formate hydrogenlyase subunit 3/multisubunit Na+/H+ antiporter MnhD subunit